MDGPWVALLIFRAPAWQLKARERWIGWSPRQRVRRLGLVVNDSRSLMLSERQRHPNLASRVLGLVLRRLSADWQGHWGPPVLMVESFVDESADRGTCYRAGGFQAVGVTAGFPRVRRDFYAAPGQPKQLYLRQLQAGACRRLRQARWSQAWTAYEAGVAGPCPFRAPALEDLLAGLSVLPDARSGHGLGHRQRLVLATAAVCTLNGCLRLSQHPPEVRATPAPGLGVSAQPRELGGDYLFGLKGHQSGILDQAQRLPAQQGFPLRVSGSRAATGWSVGASPGRPSVLRKSAGAVAGKSSPSNALPKT